MTAQAFRILVVEGSPTQFQQLRGRLEREGWSVTWAPSAQDALREVNEAAPDLILADYHLPELDGSEFCRQVRMRIDTRVIPIIILTVGDDLDIETIGLESGADDFVRKSTDTEYLVIRIKAMLSRTHRYASIVTPAKLSAGSTRLLAIDDSSTYRTYLAQQLAGEAYQLETAASGKEGLARLTEDDFDCVVVDWMMPELDGIEVCRHIDELRRRGIRQPMILMLTGKEDRAGMEQALEAGADDLVGKSADIAVVKVRIRALLRRKFYEDENRHILDVLKQKEMEAERSRMQKEAAEARAALVDKLEETVASLEYSNRQLEEFAFIAAHHLQEPTRQLIMLADMIRQRLAGDLPEAVAADLRALRDKSQRMRTLVDALRELSRIGQSPAVAEPVSLDACADAAIRSLAARIKRSGAEITRDALPEVVAHADLIALLYRHLIDNAITYVEPGQQPIIRLTATHTDGDWLFGVRDNGIGITPEDAEKIFAPLRRLHHDDKYPGLGMGLTLCRKIVERHGGRLYVESELGQGTSFYFTLCGPPRAGQAIPRAEFAQRWHRRPACGKPRSERHRRDACATLAVEFPSQNAKKPDVGSTES